jgi:hypothetical protein
MELTLLVSNLAGSIRREILGGQEYIVAPVTMIVPGVLNGSQGPLLYTLEEIGKNLERWNGIPLVVYHPTHNGEYTSARDPEVLNTQGIGRVFGAAVNGKLTAEAWFNVADVRRVDQRVLDSLEQGKPIELSTGLLTRHRIKEGTFNGEEYKAVVYDLQPDHLAILPDVKGACSIEQGCGVLINEETKGLIGNLVDSMKNYLNTKEEGLSMDKTQLLDELIKEDGIWNEEDRKVLEQLDEEKLKALSKHDPEEDKEDAAKAKKKKEQLEKVANAAIEGYKDCQGVRHTFNVEKGEWESNKEEPTSNKQSEEPNQQLKSQTSEEWFNAAPSEVQAAVRNSMDIVNREKGQLVNQLISNVEDEGRKNKLATLLKSKELEELRELSQLFSGATTESNPFEANYVGAAVNEYTSEDKPELLGQPVWNFEPVQSSNH